MKAPRLTQAMLKRVLHYDPRTGIFTWLHRSDVRPQWNGRYAGKVAGYDWSPDGRTFYRSIRIFDWPFLAHRLAVLYMIGRWPKDCVDHRKRNGLNNRWKNLRPATKAQNGANRGRNKNNVTGFKGVSRYGKRFRASFRGRQIGTADTPEAASRMYARAARRYFGQFASHR